MSYDGSCHCGAVTFTVEGAVPAEAIACNCSHCRRKGLMLAFIAAGAATITAGADLLESYTFNRHVIVHRFCRNCGCQPLATGKAPDGSAMAAINLRCVPGVDLDALAINRVDGASF